MSQSKPTVTNVLAPEGEISDELDYAVANYVAQYIGFGYTACKPQLVEISIDDKTQQAIKMALDHTFINKNNQLMGYGIVGYIYIDPESNQVLYHTTTEEIEENTKILIEDTDPQPRPRGKY